MKTNYFEILFNESRLNQASGSNFTLTSDFIDESAKSPWFLMLQFAIGCVKIKDYQSAIGYLDNAISLKSDHSFMYSLRGTIREDGFQDYEGAIIDFKNALKYGGDWYSTYHQIGVKFIYLKKYEKALIALDAAIELKKRYSENSIVESSPNLIDTLVMRVNFEVMYNNRASVKYQLSDINGCWEDITKAVELNPNYSNPYIIMGVLFSEANMIDESIAAFRTAHVKGNRNAAKSLMDFHGIKI